MNKKIHLIMPMGGRGSRFSKEGFDFPKPLIKIYDKPFFYWATRSIEKFVSFERSSEIVHFDSNVMKPKLPLGLKEP